MSSKHVVTAAHCVFEAASLEDATKYPLEASDILVRMSMLATKKVNNNLVVIRSGLEIMTSAKWMRPKLRRTPLKLPRLQFIPNMVKASS